MSEKTIAKVRALHRCFLDNFIWTPDERLYGTQEHWVNLYSQFMDQERVAPFKRKPVRGDCEDIALAWEDGLWRDLKLNPTDIQLHTCLTNIWSTDLYDHAVTGITIDDITWILCSNQRDVMPIKDLHYKWYAHAVYSNPIEWRETIL